MLKNITFRPSPGGAGAGGAFFFCCFFPPHHDTFKFILDPGHPAKHVPSLLLRTLLPLEPVRTSKKICAVGSAKTSIFVPPPSPKGGGSGPP